MGCLGTFGAKRKTKTKTKTKRKVVNITAVVQTMSLMLEFLQKKVSKVTKALVLVPYELTNTFMVLDLTDRMIIAKTTC